jgi:hypothetical protein
MARAILTAGLLLGLLVEAWTFVMGFTGWYRDPALLNLFWIVIPIELVVLVWGLRQTAALGNRYGAQVAAGLGIGVVAAAVVFVGSILFTTVAFPNYFADLQQLYEQQLRQRGLDEAMIRSTMEGMAVMQTPVVNALLGAFSTALTGLIAALVIAAFVRAPATPPLAPEPAAVDTQP